MLLLLVVTINVSQDGDFTAVGHFQWLMVFSSLLGSDYLQCIEFLNHVGNLCIGIMLVTDNDNLFKLC